MSSLIDALVLEPFSVNEPLIHSLLLEENSFEYYLAVGAGGGSGTLSDPYLVDTATKFDQLVSSFPPYTTIHLAAGLFLTQGHADGVTGGWQPKRGWRIVGAGIDVTTLKLSVAAPTANAAYFAVGGDDTNVINEIDISDLTLDANLGGFGSVAAAAGAVNVYGSHAHVRRIRVINFGTTSTSQRGVGIAIGGAFPDNPEPFDGVVEDCILDQPFPNNARETACIVLAGGERPADGVMAYHKGFVVKNCLIDCKYVSNDVPISDISIAGSVATVTTKTQHGRVMNDWVAATGALVNSSPSNPYNGSYQVGSATATSFTYTPLSVPAAAATGDMYIGRPMSQRVAIASLTFSGGIATLTTVTPHNRFPGQNVVLNNVTGMTPSINGAATINDLGATPSPTVVRFNYSGTGTPDVSKAWIGVDFYGIVANGGRGVIIEGNRILNTTFAVYRDLWGTKDMAVRDNYFYNVLAGVYESLGQLSGGDGNQQPTRTGSSLTRGSSPYLTATFTTASAHGLSAGQAVAVAGAYIGGNPAPANTYNGIFAIAAVPTPFSFTYTMQTAPGANADVSPAPKSGALWQVGRLLVENNIIELVLTITSLIDVPSAIRLERKPSSPSAPASPYVFGQVVVRSNVVRHVDNASDPTALPTAIQLNSCEGAIVEENVIKLDRADPVRFTACGAVKFFSNQAPSGALFQGYNIDNSQFVNELTTDADLSALLAT